MLPEGPVAEPPLNGLPALGTITIGRMLIEGVRDALCVPTSGLRQSCGMHPMSEYAWRQNYLPTWINAAMWRWLVMWVSDE